MKLKNRESVTLKVKRKDHPKTAYYWELFHVAASPQNTVTELLDVVARQPLNTRREATTPVVFDRACDTGSCGACSMIINGELRPACRATVAELGGLITLEPMSKFPVQRDLSVDRSVLEKNLKEMQAWEPRSFFGAWDHALPPTSSDLLTLCNGCGQCLEACPQYHDGSPYKGAAIVTQTFRFLKGEIESAGRYDRLTSLMQSGGIEDCGSNQNCVKTCPMGIPLTKVLGAISWETTKEGARRFFKE